MLSVATRILADAAAAGSPKCVNSFCRDEPGATEVEFIPSIDRALMQKDHAMCRVLGLCRPLLCVAALLALAMPTLAQDTRREFAPEGNAYFKVSDQARVYLQASVVGRPTQNTTDGELGANFDYTFKPIFRPELLNAQWERDRYLWARVGYLLGGGEEGLKDFHERRIIVQATGRILLANQFWLMHRGQVDFRDIDGQASQRYRYRAAVEREFTLQGVAVVPYAQAEIFYDTRYNAVSRQLYQFGAEVEFARQWRIEPYYARQADKLPTPGAVDRLGLVLKYYH